MTEDFARPIYIILTSCAEGTPYDVLYGSETVAFLDHDKAIAAAGSMNDAACFGRDGTQTPKEVGFNYWVTTVASLADVRYLCRGHVAAVEALLASVSLTAQKKGGYWDVVASDGAVWRPDEATGLIIDIATDPAELAVRICRQLPTLGEWE